MRDLPFDPKKVGLAAGASLLAGVGMYGLKKVRNVFQKRKLDKEALIFLNGMLLVKGKNEESGCDYWFVDGQPVFDFKLMKNDIVGRYDPSLFKSTYWRVEPSPAWLAKKEEDKKSGTSRGYSSSSLSKGDYILVEIKELSNLTSLRNYFTKR